MDSEYCIHMWPCPQIEDDKRNLKNKAAIDLQCKLNGKLKAALFFIPLKVVIMITFGFIDRNGVFGIR